MITNNKTKIFMTSTSYPRDAQDWKATFIRSMVNSLAARSDVELTFWGPRGDLPSNVSYATNARDALWFDRLLDMGGIANVLRKKNAKSITAVLSLVQKLRRAYASAPDATVIHGNWLQSVVSLKRNERPLLVTVLGTDFALLKLPGVVPLLRRIFRGGPCLIAPNADWMVPCLTECFGDVATIRCIPFGIDKGWFEISRSISASGPHRWLLVSRITRAKVGSLFEWGRGTFGNEHELHVFGPMQEEIAIPPWAQYHGATNPGELCERHFPTAAGLITLSEHDEGRPQVMLEAMAAGLPIVASPLAAHLDIIANGKTGAIVRNPEELGATLSKLSQPEENMRIGVNARSWVKEQVGTWDDCAQRYFDAYKFLLEAR
jgi:Glycosyl transferases group 1